MQATKERRSHGAPPLRNLRRILDEKGVTARQLVSRTGLADPTIRRAVRGNEGVRAGTAEKIAQALSVPAEALWQDMPPGELARAARFPTITAGRAYTYPEAATPPPGSAEPATDGLALGPGEPTMADILERLAAIEEMLMDLLTRPVAEFDVRLVQKPHERREE